MTYTSIAMLCPSRGRPEMAMRLIESVCKCRTVNSPVCLGLDSDDDLSDYLTNVPPVMKTISREPTISLLWTHMAFSVDADLYRMTNDDEVCITPGWDKRVLEVANEYPDGIFALYVNDGFKGESHCAFPIVSRKWVETLGYFAPPYFEFGYNDTWIMDLAKRVGRLRYIPEVTIEHRHFTAPNGYPRDATTEMNRQGQGKRDKERYDILEPIRALDAAKLQHVIDEDGQ